MLKKVNRFLHRNLSAIYIKNATKYRVENTAIDPTHFNYDLIIESTHCFIKSLNVKDTFQYKYSPSSKNPTLYASAYACMTFSLIGKLELFTEQQRLQWLAYFDRFQNNNDGLFYDPIIESELFHKGDWWGARHLALHMISAYTDLNGKPKYPFYFLKKYYTTDEIELWLDKFEWNSKIEQGVDIDNKIMNIGCLLQYQRDKWNDEKAADALDFIKMYLLDKVNPETGMWGQFDSNNADSRSRSVQFAYHLLPIFFYDRNNINYADKIIDHVLNTQNELGGFGVKLNSSACEDIDSIDILIRLFPLVYDRKNEIDLALTKALKWIRCNQVKDGGFVFRLFEPFAYGHIETTSNYNESSMFATWFRILSIAYIINHLKGQNIFTINRCPGYEI